ncbi:Wzz/FepE/Etk N-terminal domain-containing protein [Tunicatimonas pelagia]|uniref:Wzz/FepE/Etk N-terminal domain-containing protein n=1 Tax=Tunicatimonas pelagia TaxID=931531 RepID=UPI002665608A|nr:Wzz/FepE/Etk N-terminal domain-containing protein [Tunicatimonas pelagia]WKN40727.1 Wzz/FepE/Etk N-terminal domain-containing protein [Tunicatimonas pelagia]
MNTPKEYTETRPKVEISDENKRVSNSNESQEPLLQDGEIDLLNLIGQIWGKRNVIIVSTVVFLLFGIFIALVSPEEYTSEVVLMPQSGSSSGGTSGLLRQFGGLAGISLGGSSSGDIGIDLYPDITQSTPFFLNMMDQPIFIANMDTTAILKDYVTELIEPPITDYVKRYTIGLPKLLIGLPIRIVQSFKEEPSPVEPSPNTAAVEDTLGQASQIPQGTQKAIQLEGKEVGAIGELRQRIETSIEENGMLRVSVTMPDSYAAARVTSLSVDFLTDYLIEYKTEKAKSNLGFLERQYSQAQNKYFRAQQRLAQFRDRNSNIISATAQTEQERLEDENQLAFQVYQGLAQQLEQARITVQEQTPVFKVLEPVQVPLDTSAPNRELIIFIFIFLGIFVGFAIAVLSIIYRYIAPKLKATKTY